MYEHFTSTNISLTLSKSRPQQSYMHNLQPWFLLPYD